MSDPISHPSHYTSHPSGIEVIQVTEHMNFCLGNVVKYVLRADLKHDDGGIEDLSKAAWYLNRELERRQSPANPPARTSTPDTETEPAKQASEASQGGLRVGARVGWCKLRGTVTKPVVTPEGENPAWEVTFNDGRTRILYGWALEVIQ